MMGLQPSLQEVETHPRGQPDMGAGQVSKAYLVVRQRESRLPLSTRLGPTCRKRASEQQSSVMEAWCRVCPSQNKLDQVFFLL